MLCNKEDKYINVEDKLQKSSEAFSISFCLNLSKKHALLKIIYFYVCEKFCVRTPLLELTLCVKVV